MGSGVRSNVPAFSAFPAVTGRVRHAEPVMGTVVSFDLPVQARADGSLDDAIRWLHWVDRVFSPFRPDSDVSLLAAAEVTVEACADEVGEVITACAAPAGAVRRVLLGRGRRRVRPLGLRQGLGGRALRGDPQPGRVGQPPGQRRR